MNIRSCKPAVSIVFLLSSLAFLQAQQEQTPQQTQTAYPSQSQGSASCGPGGCITANDNRTGSQGYGSQSVQNGTFNNQPYSNEGVWPNTPGQQTRGPANNTSFPSANGLRPPLDPRLQAAPQKSNFERFVQDSLGHELPTFGQRLFLNTPIDFQATTAVSAPSDYVIGTGDQLRVHGWGTVSLDIQATVDQSGQIFLPQIGSINIAGIRADQLQSVMQHAVDAQYKGVTVTATLGQLRSIQVFVLGQVRRPGVITISSLSTLVNALFASGGPSESGSLRDVQLKRGDQIITHFDVYRLLLYGDKSKDVHLLPGDVIYVPVVGPQVALDGEVKNPAIYELLGDNSVQEAIEFAGGLSPLAELQRASLIRVGDHTKRIAQDFPLNGAQNLIPMQAGDILRVFPISSEIGKSVTLKGDVAQPGRYAWHAGLRVSDLIPDRQSLISRNYYNKQNGMAPLVPRRPFDMSDHNDNRSESSSWNTQTASREKASPAQTRDSTSTREGTAARTQDGEPEGPGDSTSTQTRTGATSQTRSITTAEAEAAGISGYVVNPADDLNLASHDAEINWNYAVIERLNHQTLKTEILSFALGEAIDNPGSPENKLLEQGDVIVIYSHNDINLPTELRARFIRIDGEVLRPGVYAIEGNETLQNVVARAGGLAPHAYLYASQLTRESVRIAEEAKLQAFILQATRDANSPINSSTLGADGRAIVADQESRLAYIRALKNVHATGRITLHLTPTASQVADLPDFAMQDGDHFFVPPRPNTVDVIGGVFSQGTLRYLPGDRVRNYLKAAGGNTREGDKKQEFVLRADGSVLSRPSTNNFDKIEIYAGDTVVVPARMKAGWSAFQFVSLGQIASSFALAAVALSSATR